VTISVPVAPPAAPVLRVPRAARALDRLALVLIAVIAAIAACTFRDYGLGWDDYTHAQYGDLLLALYTSGFTDTRAFSFVNLYMYGGGFDLLAALVAKALPFDLFETRRLVGAAVGLLGLFVTWRIGRRVGGPLAGLAALLLLATCPLFYGHMFINAKDLPFAVSMTVLLLALVRAFDEYPQPSAKTGLLFGIGLGLAIGSRVIGGLSVLYALAAFALIVGGEARTLGLRAAAARAGRFVFALLPGLILAYAVLALIWPWAVLEPLNPLRAVEYFSHFFEKPWKEMFGGAVVSVPDMPRSYVPTLFALKLPELMLILGLGGIAGALVALGRRDVPLRKRATLLLLALAATVPILFTVLTRPAMYNGIRHFIFVAPPLAVLGGLAAAWLAERLAVAPRPGAAGAGLLLLAGVGLPIYEMVRLHPYQYTHFNSIAGGIRAAEDRYMLDYWGLAFKQAAQHLRQRLTAGLEVPSHRKWRVIVCGPERPAQVELGPEFETSWHNRDADFVMMTGEFYCAPLNAPVLVEIEREGVVFARVYDVRGRSISNLLTIPPP
jgi:4-amino-4-deoxy-L-arabinose transferase-like glycosyltransferase